MGHRVVKRVPGADLPMTASEVPGAMATTYTVNLDDPEHEWITVELTMPAGRGPHKPPHDTWAVRKRGWCLNADGEWEHEPIPSSRDAEFYASHRWPLAEALERAREVAEQEALWRATPGDVRGACARGGETA